MLNEDEEVIYVGKAKQLKNRIKSYFTGAHNEKTTKLVSEIRDFNYILTNTEHESLILENNLIKKYLPKYNIRLIDDKTYPYIEITTEEHPRLEVVRQKEIKGRIFGPYPNVYAARETVRLLNRLYPLRKCETLPKKACLYYHIGQCLAPCIHKIEDYQPIISELSKFLKGDTKDVLDHLNSEMEKASSEMLYEKAIEYRDMIQSIDKTTEKQIINLNDLKDRDIVSYAFNHDDISIQILMMRMGKMLDIHQVVFSYVGEIEDSLYSYLNQYYEKGMPDEILFSDRFKIEDLEMSFGKKASIPQKGDKKKLTDLASKNADYDLEHHFMLYRYESEKKQKALDELSKMIDKKVNTIEVFDNAQLFGTSPISALIVYKNQEFDKKSYRRYHLKTTNNDDYQAMREVTYRRYYRLLVENKECPDLILIDGGKGQLNAAKEVITSLGLNIKIAGLQKDRTHTLDALVYDDQIIKLIRQSDLYKLLSKLSNEVHRFAITFHRKSRSKEAMTSPLLDIKGIGKQRKNALLKHFKSIDDMREASDEKYLEIGIPKDLIIKIKEAIK